MGKRVYIGGAGIITPLGQGLAATEAALRANYSAIRPLDLFPLLHGEPLPVGQVRGMNDSPSDLPRTHRLARIAAMEALADCGAPPDAVILGTTTGGILTTEQLLRDKAGRKEMYRYHGLHSVADYIAQESRLQRSGPGGLHRLFIGGRGHWNGPFDAALRAGEKGSGRGRGLSLPPDLFRFSLPAAG